ncbi:MAG: hypothetical protein MPJ22_12275, partial [Pirellulales bacterium]|nr:hypothetical protein [Pirellulales bacterium]
MKDIPSDVLAHYTVMGMRKLLESSPQPRTNIFGSIGKYIFMGKESTDMDDGEINRIRIKSGGAMMKVIFYKYLFIFSREKPDCETFKFEELSISTQKRVLRKIKKESITKDDLFTKRGKYLKTNSARYMIYENSEDVVLIKRFKVKGEIIEKEEKVKIEKDFVKELFEYLDIDKMEDALSPSFKEHNLRTKFFSAEKGQLVRNINLNNSKLYTLD